MDMTKDAARVREQYEAYPYPERNPEDEQGRLMQTWPEDLAQINHYCFRGRQDFRKGFRVLVAGGGTGDATIYLAEQLRDTDARIVYLDASRASAGIARRRAAVRDLENIRFVEGSLLELPDVLGPQSEAPFDYISCTGVLHHLEDPQAGLAALLSVLAPEGAMNLLLYGQYGRAAIYDIQARMRSIVSERDDMPTRLVRLKATLRSLPNDHAWRRHRLYREPDAIEDAELYDLFLHSLDRAYTLPQIHQWLGVEQGLHLQFSRINGGPIGYWPEIYTRDAATLQRARNLPPHERAALAEELAGDIDLHCFFATRHADACARVDDLDNIPFFTGGFADVLGAALADALERVPPGSGLPVRDPRSGLTGLLMPGRFTHRLLRWLDGERSLRQIFERARGSDASLAAATDAVLLAEFAPVYNVFNPVDGLLLRHRGVALPQLRRGGES